MKKEFEKPSCRIWKLSHTQWVSLTHTQTAILSQCQFGRRMYHTVHSGANESVSVKSGRLNLCVAAIFHPSNLSIRSSHGRIACAFRLTHTHNTPTETVTVTIFYRLRISKHHSHWSDFIANGRNQKFDYRKTTPNSVNHFVLCKNLRVIGSSQFVNQIRQIRSNFNNFSGVLNFDRDFNGTHL